MYKDVNLKLGDHKWKIEVTALWKNARIVISAQCVLIDVALCLILLEEN